MTRATKVCLIVAASAILLGLMIVGGVMTVLKWDFTTLSTSKLVTNEHDASEPFDRITVITDTADVRFVLSEGEAGQVVCYEEAKARHAVSVRDGALEIRLVNEKAWYDYIGISFGTPKLTVYLPRADYASLTVKGSTGDIEIPQELTFESIGVSVSTGDVTCRASATGAVTLTTSTGDISVADMTAGSLALSVSTGDITASHVTCGGDVTVGVSTGKAYLAHVTCQSLLSKGNTGDLALKRVVATERFSITRSTGDVKLDACDAAELSIKTDTGDVTGSLTSEKVFVTETDTGRVEVPSTDTGGRCEITTDTGHIKVKILPNG